jgi:hypothetical protein
MKKLPYYFIISLVFTLLWSCNHYRSFNNIQLIELKSKDKLAIYIKNYFKLSEDRNIETWYNIYLNKCTTFYKIEKPTKDSILNLIKSYWLTSDRQKHEITKIESQNTVKGKEIFVTMNYSYLVIATNTSRVINNLKLYMLLDKKNKVLLIREFSRG